MGFQLKLLVLYLSVLTNYGGEVVWLQKNTQKCSILAVWLHTPYWTVKSPNVVMTYTNNCVLK